MEHFNLIPDQDEPTVLLEHDPLVELVSGIDAKQLANYLAFNYVSLGTELLDELLYYRTLGRI